MKIKNFNYLINLTIGAILLFSDLKGLMPNLMVDKEVQIVAGVLFITIGLIQFFWRAFFGDRYIRMLANIGSAIGFLSVLIGLFSMWKGYSWWIYIMKVGIIIFL